MYLDLHVTLCESERKFQKSDEKEMKVDLIACSKNENLQHRDLSLL